jgi:hypothetical protein
MMRVAALRPRTPRIIQVNLGAAASEDAAAFAESVECLDLRHSVLGFQAAQNLVARADGEIDASCSQDLRRRADATVHNR